MKTTEKHLVECHMDNIKGKNSMNFEIEFLNKMDIFKSEEEVGTVYYFR